MNTDPTKALGEAKQQFAQAIQSLKAIPAPKKSGFAIEKKHMLESMKGLLDNWDFLEGASEAIAAPPQVPEGGQEGK